MSGAGKTSSNQSLKNQSKPSSAAGKDARRKKSKQEMGGTQLKRSEEEYRKVNAELEAKTVSIMKEAEDLMREHTVSLEPGIDINNSTDIAPAVEDTNTSDTGVAGIPSKKSKRKSTSQKTTRDDSIAIDVERVIRNIEKGSNVSYQESSANPELDLATDQLGDEALIRFLKAKVRVMQEELEHFGAESSNKEKKIIENELKLKALKDEQTKLQKSQHSLQSQLTKYRQLSQDYQLKCEGLETQLVALKRELDSQKLVQRKTATGQSAIDVRLNRALEEVEKYKSLYHKTKANSSDVAKHEKQRIEELEAQNKLLERQKHELVSALKKQMKLIDVLRQQKIHLEAARLLSFTEEEFITALDWDAN